MEDEDWAELLEQRDRIIDRMAAQVEELSTHAINEYESGIREGIRRASAPDRGVLAAAWDEGYRFSEFDERADEEPPNPYRIA